ncbi:30S ribosome-binding factor RbfA [Thermoproteota archaeon]
MNPRLEKIASTIKRDLAGILRAKVSDARIGFISITDVKISKDLEHVWIYYSQIGSENDRKRTRRGLMSATKFIRLELGKVLHLKIVPDLRFEYDDSLEKGVKLVDRINKGLD